MDKQTAVEQIKQEVNNIENNAGWHSVYQSIRAESSSFDFACSEARSAANKALNRYRDVSPYDHSRVILNNDSCNYINASLVKVGKSGRNYILTQGPLPNTASHFWLMVWEQKSKAVLMLNKIIEKSQIKCHQYWPVGSKDGGSDLVLFEDVGLKVTLLSENKSCKHFVIRTLRVEHLETKSTREVLQFHYVTWPDFGVPSTPRAFLHFLQEVRDSGALSSVVGPPVVHCSAGIGRSGTFCLVDSCLLMMESGQSVNVKDILLEMRKFRMGLIQTADQLRFSYQAILEGAQQLADGSTRFMPDLDNGILDTKEEPVCKPDPPKRDSSLSPDALWRYIQMHADVPLLPEKSPDRPLPKSPPSSEDSSSSDIDDDDDDTDSDLDDDDIDEVEVPVEEKADEVIENPANDDPQTEKLEDTNNGHAKPNGIDDPALRRRLKNELTMDKIREIKQRQKESEMKAEMYQQLYRSPVSKRRRSCSGSDAPPEEN